MLQMGFCVADALYAWLDSSQMLADPIACKQPRTKEFSIPTLLRYTAHPWAQKRPTEVSLLDLRIYRNV